MIRLYIQSREPVVPGCNGEEEPVLIPDIRAAIQGIDPVVRIVDPKGLVEILLGL